MEIRRSINGWISANETSPSWLISASSRKVSDNTISINVGISEKFTTPSRLVSPKTKKSVTVRFALEAKKSPPSAALVELRSKLNVVPSVN